MTDQSTSTKKPPRHESLDSNVKVTEMGTCSRSAWDCFILFGAGRQDEFRALAKKVKEKGLDSGYTMLIGLARLDGDKTAFEEIAVDYAVQFGQSPPSWHEAHTKKKNPNEGAIETHVESFSIDNIVEVTVKMEIHRPLILNLSKVLKVDAAGIELFNEALAGRQARGVKTRMYNGDRLVEELISKLSLVQGKPHKSLWEFCFAYLRMNGNQKLFTSAMAQYVSIGGEQTPWQDLSEPAEEEETRAGTDQIHGPERLSGFNSTLADVFLKSAAGLKARESGRVTIDMERTSMGSLIDAIAMPAFIKVLTDAKLKVSLVNVNEIFVAMFEALAIDQVVDSVSVPGTFA